MKSNDTTARVTPGETMCYRLGREELYLGIVCAILFLAVGIGSAFVAYWNIDGSFERPKLSALIFGIFWLCPTLLGLWIILAYFRERLIVSEDAITQRGCFGTKSIAVPEVIRIDWKRLRHGGTIVARSRLSRITIHLGNFTREERDELIAFFHGTFATTIQEGWPRFLEPAAKPLQLHPAAAAVLCALLLAVFAGIFIYAWVAGLGIQWLAIGIINSLASLWYMWRLCNW